MIATKGRLYAFSGEAPARQVCTGQGHMGVRACRLAGRPAGAEQADGDDERAKALGPHAALVRSLGRPRAIATDANKAVTPYGNSAIGSSGLSAGVHSGRWHTFGQVVDSIDETV